ncbi:unnamed protein product [Adineta ricciae]|uniref:G-protein coupled receptors family 1 profile domain-containing protein n=2 Tax=Adineta ricciae TaxID=249248 RepID=A0A815HTM0_ADIRI|nr:unnamed protein product [Adineta ricciae]
MSSTSLIKNAVTALYQYYGIPLLVFGCVGNVLNLLIFIRSQLKKNPCSTYFFYSSIANLNVIFLGLLSRILSDGFGIDPSSYNLGYCRFRYFILHSSMVLSSWFTILASVDRYCVSSKSARRRQLSSLKTSRFLVCSTTVIVLILYSHVWGLFTIEQLKTGPSCYAEAGFYRVFYDFFYFATFSFTPPVMMTIVGLGTFYNVHQSHTRVNPTDTNARKVDQLKKRDRQLIKMLLVQVTFTISLTLPLAIQKLYSTFTQNFVKSTYQQAVETLVTQVVRLLAFTNNSISFYLFTLSGSLYRREFFQLLDDTICGLLRKKRSIHQESQELTESRRNIPSKTVNVVKDVNLALRRLSNS